MNGNRPRVETPENRSFASMGNVNYNSMMNRTRNTMPSYQGVPYGQAPQQPDYAGNNMNNFYQQQQQQQQYIPQQYPMQQQQYAQPQRGYQANPYDQGYQTQAYQPQQFQQPQEEALMRRPPPKSSKDDVGNSFEMPEKTKARNNGGYYDFSTNSQFIMKS